MRLILASRSPRRADLLAAAGIEFAVRTVDIDETPLARESPADYVVRIARAKAMAVRREAGEIILAADTTVVLESPSGPLIIGKPVHAQDAIDMLTALAGRAHKVLTGVCMLDERGISTDYAATSVWFGDIDQTEIEDYVTSGEPMDKAGAYAIQGRASRYIERIDGEYSNVVGLPVALVWRMLASGHVIR